MKETEKFKGKSSAKKILINVGSILILVLAAISFIFIPAMVQSAGNEIPPFGYYDKKPIEYKQGSYFTNLVQMYSDQVGSANVQNAYFDIFNSAFTGSVLNIAFSSAVEKSGYVVPAPQVDRAMLPYFYDTNGVYSPKIFNDTPDSTKIELRNAMEDNLIFQRYTEDVFGSQTEKLGTYTMYGLKSPSAEKNFVSMMDKNKRGFSLASFSLLDYPDTEVAKWGESNKDLFIRYDMSVISVADATTAETVLGRIKNNELVFEDAVTEYSTNYYSGTDGKLTSAYKHQLQNILTDAISLTALQNLPAGQISEVMQTQNGYAIFKNNTAPTPADMTDADTLAAVRSYMSANEKGIIEDYFLNIAKDFWTAASTSSFAEACTQFNITPVDIPPFALNYGNSPVLTSLQAADGSMVNAEQNENFLKTIFSMKLNEISSPMVLNDNVVVLQYTQEDNTVSAENTASTFAMYSTYFDQTSVQNSIMSSDKLENNFLQVFYKYIMGF